MAWAKPLQPDLSKVINLIHDGRLPEALTASAYLVERYPQHAPVWNLRGALLLETGNISEAEAALKESLRLAPDSEKAHANLASLYAQTGDSISARVHYHHALDISPTLVPAHINLGRLAKQDGLIDQAIEHFQTAYQITKAPETAWEWAICCRQKNDLSQARTILENALNSGNQNESILGLLGTVCLELNDLATAITALQRANSFEPQKASNLNNLGVAYIRSNRHQEAIAPLQQAISLEPDNPEFQSSLGNALTACGRSQETVSMLEKLLTHWPNNINILTNLGIALIESRQPELALPHLMKACSLAHWDPETHTNLGAAYEALGHDNEAKNAYLESLRLAPQQALPHNNLGNLSMRELALSDAESYYQTAIKIQPDLADAHMNLGLLYLLQGKFTVGWEEYEWRTKATSEKSKYPALNIPLWQGEPLVNRKILLLPEQGLGDTIQFIRYAPMLKELGATVVASCPKTLKALLGTASGIDFVLGDDDPLPLCDFYIPLLSLPRAFHTDLTSIPGPSPYLFADPQKTSQWHKKIHQLPGKKVGIAWAGNPAHRNDRNRSCPFSVIEPLLHEKKSITFFSLQKDCGINDCKRTNIIDFSNEWEDFSDTAAFINNLDLVISVDTSVAHVAAALGKPTWLLLPYAPDWRWLLDCPTSPWYPSIKIFRQNQQKNWQTIVDTLKELV